jgi:fructokinase
VCRGQEDDNITAGPLLSAPRRLYGAIEAGGTKFVCAAGFGRDAILDEQRIPTTTPAETLSRVVQFFERVEQEVGALQAFGLAAFGPIDLRLDSSRFGHLLPTPKAGWSGTDLLGPLRERFGCPIAIDTDVNAAAVAEARFGAGVGTKSLVYVTVGTGIGGGAVIDGHTVRGLMHPEMGHLYVRRHASDQDFAGVCPFHGDCAEGLASGPAMLSRWGTNVDDWRGDHPGFEIIGDYLGQLAASIMLMLSCERIVFGGGVMASGRLLPYIRTACNRTLNGYLPLEVTGGQLENHIVGPGLCGRSGLAGAFVLAGEAAQHS